MKNKENKLKTINKTKKTRKQIGSRLNKYDFTYAGRDTCKYGSHRK